MSGGHCISKMYFVCINSVARLILIKQVDAPFVHHCAVEKMSPEPARFATVDNH